MHQIRANDMHEQLGGSLDTYNQSAGHNPTEAWDSSYVTVNHSLWEKTGLLASAEPVVPIHPNTQQHLLRKAVIRYDSLQFHENPPIQRTGTKHPQGG